MTSRRAVGVCSFGVCQVSDLLQGRSPVGPQALGRSTLSGGLGAGRARCRRALGWSLLPTLIAAAVGCGPQSDAKKVKGPGETSRTGELDPEGSIGAPGAASGAAPEAERIPAAGPAGLLRGRVLAPEGRAFEVEVVQDDLSRQRGLQQRVSLGEKEGMLFIFPTAAVHRFWMYQCLIPLDIIWLGRDRKVIHVEEGLPICGALPCPDYGPNLESVYVLELGAGIAASSGIRPGTSLEFLFAEPPHPR